MRISNNHGTETRETGLFIQSMNRKDDGVYASKCRKYVLCEGSPLAQSR
jgi:hypothetical protein